MLYVAAASTEGEGAGSIIFMIACYRSLVQLIVGENAVFQLPISGRGLLGRCLLSSVGWAAKPNKINKIVFSKPFYIAMATGVFTGFSVIILVIRFGWPENVYG